MFPILQLAVAALVTTTGVRTIPRRLPRGPRALAGTIDDLSAWISANGGGGSVKVAEVGGGLRGLVSERGASVGDVLLEVPLARVLANRGGGDPMEAEPPEWCSALPWNVQLALSVLSRQGTAEWEPFLATWPAGLPELPMGLEPEALAEAQDTAFETEADASCFWLQEQYFNAFDAAEAHHAAAAGAEAFSFPPEPAFRRAMLLVWSRCLRLTAGVYGVRRLLVPLLDMANHDGDSPAALFAYSPAGAAGPCIRLYAARPLAVGEEVTITYGEHSNGHFAQYYGFVPAKNAHDAVSVSLLALLESSGVSPPETEWGGGGWAAACEALQARFGLQVEGLKLGASAPCEATVLGLRAALSGETGAAALMARLEAVDANDLDDDEDDEEDVLAEAEELARVAEVVAAACIAYEAAQPTTLEQDDAALSAKDIPWASRLLVEVRRSRKLLVRALEKSMRQLAAKATVDPGGAGWHLAELMQARSTYPQLDLLPMSELEGWASRRWDWEAGRYERSDN